MGRNAWLIVLAMIVLAAAAASVSLLSLPWPAHGPPGPWWLFPVWIVVGLVLAAVGLAVGLVAGAIGLVVGLALAATAVALALSFFAVPLGIVLLVAWLVARDRRSAAQSNPVLDGPRAPPGAQP